MEKLNRLLLDCGVASRPLPGERQSGDRHVVKQFRNGALVAAVDGLGHGAEAARAARLAVAVFEHHADESLIPLLERCHSTLTGTRGVVASLGRFNWHDHTLTWLGVGNVEGWFIHLAANSGAPEREALVLRGGVVGHKLPSLRAFVLPVTSGDTLIFATDGIRSGFAEGLILSDSPTQIAKRTLALYAKASDDALVLAVRYVGSAA